jgi:diguanylate cyclase (GGDEF)-like protein/PAS domain S-box-containing protein
MTSHDAVGRLDVVATPSADTLYMQNLLDDSDEVIYFKDLQSRFLRVSLGCALLHRTTQDGLVGLTDHDLFAAVHADAALADEQRIIATGVPMLNKEERERWHDRPDTWVASSKFPLREPDGTIVGTFGISRDITRRVMAEEERRLAGIRLRTVLDSSTDQIAKYDAELRYQYLNPAGEGIRGVLASEVIGKTDREWGMLGEAALAGWESALRRVVETGEPGEIELATPYTDGSTRWFHTRLGPDRDLAGNVVGVLASTRDITTIKAAEHALAHQATHDGLTGLANRALVMERLGVALARMERLPGHLVVLFVDIDRFKDINDTFGHSVGDAVLVEVAHRLTAVARREDMVARLAGDEFVVVCERVPSREHVAEIAARVVETLHVAYDDGTLRMPLSASVGVAVARDSRATASDLLSRADAAMYRAKHGGRNSFRVSEGDTDLLPEAVELEKALDEGQFSLVYQPLLSLADRRVVGFEALLRWDHPERGILAPDQFLAAAERTGVIRSLGAWVLDAACSHLAEWAATTGHWSPDLLMSVNVASGQLTAEDFPEIVRETLLRHGVAPDRLRLEISERTLVGDAAVIAPALQRLSALGVELAVDNFGASVASIARLPRLPVRVVKLDRFTDVDRQREVVAAVVATAHALGMTIVAGGIEDSDQLAELSSLSFDGGQGHLLGSPMPPAEVSRLIAVRPE